MKKLKGLSLFITVIAMLFPSISLGQHAHGQGSSGGGMKMDTREVLVEGVKVTFQIMPNDEHKKMLKEMKMKDDVEPGTTHNITVLLKDEKSQKEITDAAVSMKLVDPKGKDQIKSLKYESSMKSYDGYFNLAERGSYQILILFRSGAQKRTAGINYDYNG